MSQRRQQYVFRPNHQNPLQRQAWQILQATPAAERRTLVAQAIVNFHNDQAAEARLQNCCVKKWQDYPFRQRKNDHQQLSINEYLKQRSIF